MRRSITLVISLLAAFCASQPRVPRAPWQQPPLRVDQVTAVYLEQWVRAENRASCALFAFASLGDGAGASPRAATFAGGWAVAYDLPGSRSAFGIAGTGVDTSGDDIYSKWPANRRWSDGSVAGYGPEGGTGPNQLAYVRIAGQGCLYNVWSRLGREHLELLLESIRRVDASPASHSFASRWGGGHPHLE